jgi:hypothetical protein
MARPTKLTKELVEKASKYIDETKMGGQFFGDLPTIEGLAIYLDIRRSTIYEWEAGSTTLQKQFSDIVDDVKTHQAYKLVGKGLKGEYNAAITKLMLSKHGYVEKSEVDSTVKGAVEFVNTVPRPPKDGEG